jgi:hypothetical protein
MSDTIVVDVSQDWETACDVQQGFMQHPAPAAEGGQLQRTLPAAPGLGR